MLDIDLLVSAATIMLAGALATILVFFALLAAEALWRQLELAWRRHCARVAIRLLAIQTERYARMGRDALAMGTLTKARTFRLAAESCADQAFALARETFAIRGAA